ncbi:bacillithiol system redox-active protein YtxJ [Patiriisocius marinus]|uniref:Thioredoxin family protein n=1 Tax=Patiriisocius marinus TaxID=1397112 RepID=A0A5J4J4R8_9FLAO|nr:bacillithiol system redox-active protein YtxJ [Patiriisocius marinus]GER60883.1 thioredoxin family protein [Patiriisocius marinus]
MGLFSKFKKSESEGVKKDVVQTPWNVLSRMEQLEEIAEMSNAKPVAIFKHSTRCGISRMVLKQFENSYSLTDNELKLYYLDLLNFRNISDEVGFKFQVIHQSPQLIVIKNGVAVASASHHNIRAEELQQFI